MASFNILNYSPIILNFFLLYTHKWKLPHITLTNYIYNWFLRVKIKFIQQDISLMQILGKISADWHSSYRFNFHVESGSLSMWHRKKRIRENGFSIKWLKVWNLELTWRWIHWLILKLREWMDKEHGEVNS